MNKTIIHKDAVFVVGSASPAHAETEVLSDNAWTVRAPYPFGEAIAVAPVLYHNDQFIVFGGWGPLGAKSKAKGV